MTIKMGPTMEESSGEQKISAVDVSKDVTVSTDVSNRTCEYVSVAVVQM